MVKTEKKTNWNFKQMQISLRIFFKTQVFTKNNANISKRFLSLLGRIKMSQ